MLARRISVTYLSDTTMVSDQKISDTMPITFSGVSGSPPADAKTVCSVYSGLVPISP